LRTSGEVRAQRVLEITTEEFKAAMSKQRLVASWRLLGKRPFGHPKYNFGQAEEYHGFARLRTANFARRAQPMDKPDCTHKQYPQDVELE
jgi:hypothetical protein